MLVGERVNAQGSRKVKRLLLADDYDGILQRGPRAGGGRRARARRDRGPDRARRRGAQMRSVVKKLRASIEAPLVIDSTEADVIEAALKSYPGRAIVNSINMERGRERIEAVVPHGGRARRGGGGHDHRRGGHGADRRPQGRGLQAHLRHLHVDEYGLPADA